MHASTDKQYTCWASSTNECDRGPSDEHLLSKGLFPEKHVHVTGFDWCKDRTVSIGINSLVRQILCGKHNNQLSETDSEAIKAINLFQRTEPPIRGEQPFDNRIDGHKFERWLLKTAINVSYDNQYHIGVGMADSLPGIPPSYLVDVAMGKIQFSHEMGAHFIFPNGESVHNPHEIIIIPLIKDDFIGGFYFELRSQAIFLNLNPGHAPETLGSVATIPLQAELLDAKLGYRPPFIASAAGGMPTGMVRFNW